MKRALTRRLVLVAGLVAAVVATFVVLPAGTATFPEPFGGFAVAASGSRDPALFVSLVLPPDRDPSARITIFVPRGVELFADRPPGSSIGLATMDVEDTSGESALGSWSLEGPIVSRAVPPDHGCATGAPSGVWYLELTLLGGKRLVPIFISETGAGDPAGAALKLELCEPELAGGGTPTGTLQVMSLELELPGLGRPVARGKYLWIAGVAPLAADGATPAADGAFELQSLMAVPNRLTLRGRYDARAKVAVLDGRLDTLAPVAPRTTVYLTALVRKITDDGVVFRDRFVGATRLDQRGRFSFKTRIKKTTGFTVSTGTLVRRCAPHAGSPAGCLGMTIASADSDPVTVSLPG